jgi:transcriptional regulator with XRE-family HTH domain
MKNPIKTFGQTIYEARKREGYKLEVLASLITKEDGEPITHQYLSDLEKDRRNPPSDRIIQELARELKIPVADLYLKAKRFPPNFDLKNEEHVAAARAMMRKLEKPREEKEAAAA